MTSEPEDDIFTALSVEEPASLGSLQVVSLRSGSSHADLKASLIKNKELATFEKAAPSRRKEFVRQIEEAKAPETRESRIEKIVASLRA